MLTNESLKPSKLEAHLNKCYPVLQNKNRDFFERKAKCLKGIKFGAQGSRRQQLLATVEASYVVAYKVAKQQKCRTIAETLIMPCAKAMVQSCVAKIKRKTECCAPVK